MGPPATLKLLDHAGVHVNVIPTGNTLEDFNQRIDVIAQITDKASQANVIKQHVRETMETLEKEQAKTLTKSHVFNVIKRTSHHSRRKRHDREYHHFTCWRRQPCRVKNQQLQTIFNRSHCRHAARCFADL